MKRPFHALPLVAMLAAGALAPQAAQACSVCGCLLNSDWASQGYKADPGWSADLRFDFSNQTQLRSGTSSVDRGSLPLPNEAEIQRSTINRVGTLTLDYAQAGDWGLAIALPYAVRTHDTYAEGDTDLSYSRSAALGDVKLVGRYQGFAPDGSLGVLFGVKLPTGRTDVAFSSGPQQGGGVDRGLQPGTGTTDLIVGAYHFGQYSEDLGYFVQVQHQQPLNTHDEFKPSAQTTLSAGMRWSGMHGFDPALQISLRHEGRESGAQADVDNSGATLAYLSPGINAQLGAHTSAYAYVQLPVYQRVNGLQLEPRYNLTLGLNQRF